MAIAWHIMAPVQNVKPLARDDSENNNLTKADPDLGIVRFRNRERPHVVRCRTKVRCTRFMVDCSMKSAGISPTWIRAPQTLDDKARSISASAGRT